MKRLLWIGDACIPTGFATVTHNVLRHLSGWNINVLAFGYDGRPHHHPYQIEPVGDLAGLRDKVERVKPDMILINSDWWNVSAIIDILGDGWPVTAYMPVDGMNVDRMTAFNLNRLRHAFWYCEFGLRMARMAGYSGANTIIPHGYEESDFSPVLKSDARRILGLPQKSFIVGNVNRNQPRKRLDLSIGYFAKWQQVEDADAYLLLHCALNDVGWDLMSLAKHYGVSQRVIFTGCERLEDMMPQSRLKVIYSALDVQISTSDGEGWGLTTMEGMACGVHQIVPDFAALGEWPEPASRIPCLHSTARPGVNTIGMIPEFDGFSQALSLAINDRDALSNAREESIRFVTNSRFEWSAIAGQFNHVLTEL